LLDDYVAGESFMNEEINLRTSDDLFDCLEENIYRVNDTGASISTACSVSLLHRYCDNLPRDMYVRTVYYSTQSVSCNPLLD
jgi:endoribonuclease Dicer